ncbi:MAG: diguanylate cyclase [Candidatus Cloacimonetes bacterium]|nr:diguanylate cyclase [Candidatus Cloacimonadota bacterium]
MEKKKILIVEDERLIAKDIQRTLMMIGYEVPNPVKSGKEALKMAKELKPDLVLVDIKLEGNLNGTEITDTIQNKLKIPVIYLTAYSDKQTISDAKVTGPFGYLIKPFDDRELHTTIEMALYKFKLEKRSTVSRVKIENLHNTAFQLAGCEKEGEVYQITIKAAEEILNFSICSLSIKEGKNFFVKASSSKLQSKSRKEFKFGEGLSGKTLSSGETYVFGKSDELPEVIPEWDKLQSGISSPIGEFGVFQVASFEENAFNNDDVKLLELLLGHATKALSRVQFQNELREQAIIDSLTGVYNRFFLYQALEQELKHSKRYNRPIAFIIVDVNNLKGINDKYGHQMGDKALQYVASLLVYVARESDIVVRNGGDEFLVMLPETGKEVEIVEKRIKENLIIWNKTKNKFPFTVTFAVGGAFWERNNPQTVEEIIAIADQRMYEDKRNYS